MLNAQHDHQHGLTVVGRILLSRNHRLRVEQGPVGTRLDVVDGARLKIDVKRAGDVLARTRLGEERRKAAVAVRRRALSGTTVRLAAEDAKMSEGEGKEEEDTYVQPVLERVELPYARHI